MCSPTCGTTALPSPLSRSTRAGTPCATRARPSSQEPSDQHVDPASNRHRQGRPLAAFPDGEVAAVLPVPGGRRGPQGTPAHVGVVHPRRMRIAHPTAHRTRARPGHGAPIRRRQRLEGELRRFPRGRIGVVSREPRRTSTASPTVRPRYPGEGPPGRTADRGGRRRPGQRQAGLFPATSRALCGRRHAVAPPASVWPALAGRIRLVRPARRRSSPRGRGPGRGRRSRRTGTGRWVYPR
jgi:hypothetical protein